MLKAFSGILSFWSPGKTGPDGVRLSDMEALGNWPKTGARKRSPKLHHPDRFQNVRHGLAMQISDFQFVAEQYRGHVHKGDQKRRLSRRALQALTKERDKKILEKVNGLQKYWDEALPEAEKGKGFESIWYAFRRALEYVWDENDVKGAEKLYWGEVSYHFDYDPTAEINRRIKKGLITPRKGQT